VPVASESAAWHVRLTAAGPFHAIVVTGEVVDQVPDLAALYRMILFHVVPGGRLLVVDLAPGRPAPGGLWPLLSRLIALREPATTPRADPDEAALAAATTRVTIEGRRLAVTKGTTSLAKLRDSEVNFVLRQRGGRDGVVLEHIEPERFEPRSIIRDHREDSRLREQRTISVPGLSLRQYNQAYCVPRQITVLGNHAAARHVPPSTPG
jgi:hypothetical protein